LYSEHFTKLSQRLQQAQESQVEISWRKQEEVLYPQENRRRNHRRKNSKVDRCHLVLLASCGVVLGSSDSADEEQEGSSEELLPQQQQLQDTCFRAHNRQYQSQEFNEIVDESKRR
jgi:hypothetical protein